MNKIRVTNAVLFIGAMMFLGYHYIRLSFPVTATDYVVDEHNLYVIDDMQNNVCNVDFTLEENNPILFTAHNEEYYYTFENVGNGTCSSDLYMWIGLRSVTLPEALNEGIIEEADLIDADFVKTRSAND